MSRNYFVRSARQKSVVIIILIVKKLNVETLGQIMNECRRKSAIRCIKKLNDPFLYEVVLYHQLDYVTSANYGKI